MYCVPIKRIQGALAAWILKVTLSCACDQIRAQKLLYCVCQRGLAAESMLLMHHAPGCCQVAVIPAVVLEYQSVQQLDGPAFQVAVVLATHHCVRDRDIPA